MFNTADNSGRRAPTDAGASSDFGDVNALRGQFADKPVPLFPLVRVMSCPVALSSWDGFRLRFRSVGCPVCGLVAENVVAVRDILARSTPFQVNQSVVRTNTVLVVAVRSKRIGTKESQKHKAMDREHLRLSPEHVQIHGHVAVSLKDRLQDSARLACRSSVRGRRNPTNPSFVAYVINPLVADDGKPVFSRMGSVHDLPSCSGWLWKEAA